MSAPQLVYSIVWYKNYFDNPHHVETYVNMTVSWIIVKYQHLAAAHLGLFSSLLIARSLLSLPRISMFLLDCRASLSSSGICWNKRLIRDMVKHQSRVMSYELRVESLKARVTSLKAWVKIQKCEFKFTSYEFKSTSYEFKSTSSRIIKLIKTKVNSHQIFTRN